MKRLRDALLARLIRAFGWGVRRLSQNAALEVGRGLGELMRRAMPKRVRVASENLAFAFPEWTPLERRALVREHFEHLGMNIVELLLFPQWEDRFATRIEIEGREHLDRAVKSERGIVVFLPHTGNWEMLAPLWTSLHPNPMVIVQRLPNEALDRIVSECRGVTGLELVDRNGGLRKIVAGLKAGRACGLLADQDGGSSGVFVPFFGRMASCEPSPVAVARRLGTPLLLCMTFRQADGSHRVFFDLIPQATDGDDNERDRSTLETLYARLEARIREHPAQWLWIHRRWKTQPASSP
ncbi:MAG: lysophospholipid acyltransferase family protein [Candidatus Poribacteria bacterium]|nr:lysophospholipid acyltransferase family protein [Candidatus Poribacteria bacterium]